MPFDFTVNIPSGGGGGPTDPVDPPVTGNPLDWAVQGDETGSQDFTFGTFPAQPMAGEPFYIFVTGYSGWPPLNDIKRQVEIGYEYGDPGSTYLSNLQDGNRSAGPNGAHVWETPGNYTITIIAREPGGKSRTKTVSVTVTDPDAYAWTRTAYISFAGNFTDAPAASATVLHISNASQFNGIAHSSGADVRYRFRRGETYEINGNAKSIPTNTTWRVDTWGSGSRPIIRPNNPSVQSRDDNTAIFRASDHTNCFGHVVDIEFDGGYDPVTCTAPRGMNYFIVRGKPAGTQVSSLGLFNCKLTGVESGTMTIGRGTHDGRTYESVYNCEIRNWKNYGIGGFGGTRITGHAGNIVAQHPFATRLADAKTAQATNAPDHGPMRSQCAEYQCVIAGIYASSNGWSPLGGTYSHGGQTCLRLHAIDEGPRLPEAVQNVWGNLLSSDSSGVAAGTHSPSNKTNPVMPGYPLHTLVHCNEFFSGGQGYTGFASNNAAGGLRLWNNLMVRLNLLEYGNGTNRRNYIVDLSGNFRVLSNVVNQPMYCGQNTVVNLRTTARHGSNAQDFERENNDGTWTGPNVTYFGNVMDFDGLGNANSEGNFTLSPGDDFNLVTGSPNGLNAISGANASVYDRLGKLRRAQTNAGAYDTEVSSVTAATAPNITNATISVITTTPEGDFWSLSDADTNLLDHRIRFDVRWFRNGTPVSLPLGGYYIMPTSQYSSGTITAEITVATYGGIDTVVSNGLAA